MPDENHCPTCGQRYRMVKEAVYYSHVGIVYKEARKCGCS